MDPDRPLLAAYANWFNIGYNYSEFVLDFGQFHREEPHPLVHTRIVAGPAYAKQLGQLLSQSLARYEAAFGPIPDTGDEEERPKC